MPSPLFRESDNHNAPALTREELEAECERLRRRTHEIQEAADKKMGKLESQVTLYRNRFAVARDRVAPWIATWTTDPPSQERFGWWNYASQDQVDEITALVTEVREAQAEAERLRGVIADLYLQRPLEVTKLRAAIRRAFGQSRPLEGKS